MSALQDDHSSSSSDSDEEIGVQNEAISAPVMLSPVLSSPVGGDSALARIRSPSFNYNSSQLRPRSVSISSHGDEDNQSQVSSIVSGTRSRSGSIQSFYDIANRPRSNPRNRTPMKNSNVVLGTINRSSISSEEATTPASRPSSASRSRNPIYQPRIMFGTGLPVGTILNNNTLTALHEHRVDQRDVMPQAKSNKQGPGHRKVRRWNNDKFIGISADISHHNPLRGAKIANIYAEAEMNKWQYTMPNVPRDNRTIFGTLLSTNSLDMNTERNCKVKLSRDQLDKIRQQFVEGEVGASKHFSIDHSSQRVMQREEQKYKSGRRMLKENVNSRLLNVVSRACIASRFSKEVLCAFERLIVGYMSSYELISSPYDMQDDIDIWNRVLIQKPFITRKVNTNGETTTLRFLFDDIESVSAFNRLLLHSVTQFHGLETGSSNTSRGKLLTVTGLCKGSQFRLMDYVLDNTEVVEDKNKQSEIPDETNDTALVLETIAASRVF